MQTRIGAIPPNATGLIFDSESHNWRLYRLPTVGHWLNLKLIHAGPIEGAANYWLAWHLKEKRIAGTGNAARLAAHRPEEYKMVQDVMAELYPALTEEDMAL